MFKQFIISVLAVTTSLSPLLAYASSYEVRIPVEEISFAPAVATYDFGKVLVGQRPQRLFTFYNMSSKAVTLDAPAVTGNASIVQNGCTGTLAPAQSCNFTAALAVPTLGPVAGEIRISHSGSDEPNIYYLKGTGISADGVVSAEEVMISFGDTAVRVPVSRPVRLRNKGSQPLDILDVSLAESTSHYILDNSGCVGALEPNAVCEMTATFNPQALGLHQSRVRVELGDGTQVSVSTLVGTAVQGMPAWSSSQLNFLDVPVGQASAAQGVTLSNVGRGPLNISGITVEGDNAFKVVSHNCGQSLPPNAGCTVSVNVTAPDSDIRSAFLQVNATNTTMTVSRIQLYARPAGEKAVLTISPTALAFGNVALGSSATLSLTMRSTGEKAVVVSGYNLSGAQAGEFSILNASSCIGTLAPGMECTLQLKATPTVLSARSALLNFTAVTTESVPSVPLSASGVSGSLSVAPSSLSFGDVQQGASKALTATLTNLGAAPVAVGALSSTAAASNGFGVTGCTGQTLAPGATCVLTVTFTPASTGAKSASITVANSGSPAVVGLNVSGSGIAAPAAAATFSAFTCPTPAQTNVVFDCTAQLTNTGPVSLGITGGAVKSAVTFGPASHNCGASLPQGASCTVTVRGSFASPGTYTNTIWLNTTAGALSKLVSATVAAPAFQLTASSHAATATGATSLATHVLSNTGPFAIGVLFPPTVTTSSRPAGAVDNPFTYVGTTCGATLAPGLTCTFTSRFAPGGAGVYAGKIEVGLSTASGTPASVSQAFSGTGVASAPSASLEMTPSLLDFGTVAIGPFTAAKTATVYNRGTSAIRITGIALSGANPADFAVMSNGCLKTLYGGTSCTLTLAARPAAEGVRTAQVRIVSDFTGTVSTPTLTVTGAQGKLTVSPAALDFGNNTVGVAGTRQVLVANTGVIPVLVNLPRMEGTNSTSFKADAACSSRWLQPQASCLMTVSFNPAKTGPFTASLVIPHNAAGALTRVALSGTGIAAPIARGVLGAFACPASISVNETFVCTATLSSVGEATLGVYGWAQTNAALGALSNDCPASLTPGQSCTVRWTGKSAAAGTFANSVTARTSAGNLTQAVNVTVQGLNVKLTVAPHGSVQIGASGTATHMLTNLSAVTVSMSAIPGTVVGTGFALASTTCGATLASGASCEYVTRCTPATVGALTGTLRANYVGGVEVGALTCAGQAGSASIAPAGDITTEAGGHSRPGNWMRLANTGLGPVTVAGFFPANANWTLFSEAANSAHCGLNKVLQPGQTCLLMEVLTASVPGTTYAGKHRVRTSAGDLTWDSTIRVSGVSVQQTSTQSPLQTNDTRLLDFAVTNLAPYPLSAVTPKLTGAGFALESNSCTGLSAAGKTGSSCTIRVRATAGARATRMAGTLTVSGAYPQVINAVAYPSVGSGVQGSITWGTDVVVPKMTWTIGAYPKTRVGESTTAQHNLRNDGVAPVSLTGPVTVTNMVGTLVGATHALVSSTCAGTLSPGQSCTVTTRFTPTGSTNLSGRVTAPTSVGPQAATLTGNLVAQGDVSVTVDDGLSATLVNGTTTFRITVKNSSGASTPVALNFGATTSGTAIVSRTAATCVSTASCTVSGSQAALVLPAGAAAVITQTLTFNGTPGAVTMSATASVTEIQDSNPANNTASNSTEVGYPQADLAVSIASPKPKYGIEGDHELMVTVRNLSAASNAFSAPGSAGQAAVSFASAAGGATATLKSVVCATTTAGATCSNDGSVYLPAGASVTYKVVFTAGSAVGSVTMTATVAKTTVLVTDPNLTNNQATAALVVEAIPVEKWCVFRANTMIGTTEGENWKQGISPQPYVGVTNGCAWSVCWYAKQVAYLSATDRKWYWQGTNAPMLDASGRHVVNTKVWDGFLPRLVFSDNVAALRFADTADSTATYYGSALFKTPDSFPSSYSNPVLSPDPSYGQRYLSWGQIHPRPATWIPYWNSYTCPAGTSKTCRPYEGYRATTAGAGMQVVWREYSPGAGCGSTAATRLR